MKPFKVLAIIAFCLFQFTSCKTVEVEKPAETYLPGNVGLKVDDLKLTTK